MPRGKYSPNLPPNQKQHDFIYNCYGKVPPSRLSGEKYDEKIHFDNYDINGFDQYGYSCFDSSKNYLGIGSGIDRNGCTEYEYSLMSAEEFEDYI